MSIADIQRVNPDEITFRGLVERYDAQFEAIKEFLITLGDKIVVETFTGSTQQEIELQNTYNVDCGQIFLFVNGEARFSGDSFEETSMQSIRLLFPRQTSDEIKAVIFKTSLVSSGLNKYLEDFEETLLARKAELEVYGKGEAATITVGDVVEGEEAAVENVGTPYNAVLDFTIPRARFSPATYTTKENLEDSDIFVVSSTSSNFKTLWGNIKAKLKTFFDGIYQSLTAKGTYIENIESYAPATMLSAYTVPNSNYDIGVHFVSSDPTLNTNKSLSNPIPVADSYLDFSQTGRVDAYVEVSGKNILPISKVVNGYRTPAGVSAVIADDGSAVYDGTLTSSASDLVLLYHINLLTNTYVNFLQPANEISTVTFYRLGGKVSQNLTIEIMLGRKNTVGDFERQNNSAVLQTVNLIMTPSHTEASYQIPKGYFLVRYTVYAAPNTVFTSCRLGMQYEVSPVSTGWEAPTASIGSFTMPAALGASLSTLEPGIGFYGILGAPDSFYSSGNIIIRSKRVTYAANELSSYFTYRYDDTVGKFLIVSNPDTPRPAPSEDKNANIVCNVYNTRPYNDLYVSGGGIAVDGSTGKIVIYDETASTAETGTAALQAWISQITSAGVSLEIIYERTEYITVDADTAIEDFNYEPVKFPTRAGINNVFVYQELHKGTYVSARYDGGSFEVKTDDVPTENSTKPITSHGIFTTLLGYFKLDGTKTITGTIKSSAATVFQSQGHTVNTVISETDERIILSASSDSASTEILSIYKDGQAYRIQADSLRIENSLYVGRMLTANSVDAIEASVGNLTLTAPLALTGGGTGGNTASDARINLGVPPTNHASSASTYGVGSSTHYGHVKVDNTITNNSPNAVSGGAVFTALGTKLPVITELSSISELADGDAVPVYDTSESTTGKTTITAIARKSANIIKTDGTFCYRHSATATVSSNSANWTASGLPTEFNAPYKQTLTIRGLLDTDIPYVSIVYSGTTPTSSTNLNYQTAFLKIRKVFATNNTLTLYASEIPENDIPIMVVCYRQ